MVAITAAATTVVVTTAAAAKGEVPRDLPADEIGGAAPGWGGVPVKGEGRAPYSKLSLTEKVLSPFRETALFYILR